MQFWRLIIDFEALALLAVAVVNLTLGALFACRSRAGAMRRAFGMFAIFVGLWPMAHFFFRSLPLPYAAFALRAAYVAAVGIAISLWFFVKYLPDEQKIPHARKEILIFSGLLLSAALFIPQFLIQEVFSTPQGRSATLSLFGFLIFSIYFLGMFGGSLMRMYRKCALLDDTRSTDTWFLFWGLSIAGAFGVFFNLVLASPMLGHFEYMWIGPLFTVVYLTPTFAAMWRRDIPGT